ncbi:MAG: hypothetical protein WBE32_09015, partial [Pseudolabrys sp.]
MAIEQTPTEPDLRAPRRRRRELNSLLWLCGWGGFTAVALTALAIASQTETASERLRHIFAMNESSAIARMPPRVAQLETETQRLAVQVRALTTDRDRLAGRIALLESSIDDMTGAIKKQAVATATALAARVPPPTPAHRPLRRRHHQIRQGRTSQSPRRKRWLPPRPPHPRPTGRPRKPSPCP